MSEDKRLKKNNKIIVVLLLILLLIFVFFLFRGKESSKVKSFKKNRGFSELAEVSIDSLVNNSADSIKINKIDTVIRFDKTKNKNEKKTFNSKLVQRDKKKNNKNTDKYKGNDDVITSDSLESDFLELLNNDSVGDYPDSNDLTIQSPKNGSCSKDTVAPWIYPDPSGGMHRKAIKVRLLSVEECVIKWKFNENDEWNIYDGKPIIISKDAVIIYTGQDTCGNILDPRKESYLIRASLKQKKCLEGMEYVKVGKTEFCIDKYEWPNKKGVKPEAFISLYHASDSCFAVGKRLCTSAEWSLACGGVYGWKYPYGNKYEPHACNTQDSVIYSSGKLAECRGYFDVYDMAGNLAEWTSTSSRKNSKFNDVMGGFWNSGPQSSCFERRHSYFPQNRHNPVGFRCCSEVKSSEKENLKY